MLTTLAAGGRRGRRELGSRLPAQQERRPRGPEDGQSSHVRVECAAADGATVDDPRGCRRAGAVLGRGRRIRVPSITGVLASISGSGLMWRSQARSIRWRSRAGDGDFRSSVASSANSTASRSCGAIPVFGDRIALWLPRQGGGVGRVQGLQVQDSAGGQVAGVLPCGEWAGAVNGTMMPGWTAFSTTVDATGQAAAPTARDAASSRTGSLGWRCRSQSRGDVGS